MAVEEGVVVIRIAYQLLSGEPMKIIIPPTSCSESRPVAHMWPVESLLLVFMAITLIITAVFACGRTRPTWAEMKENHRQWQRQQSEADRQYRRYRARDRCCGNNEHERLCCDLFCCGCACRECCDRDYDP
jgi:hypothetical protein